jgi:DNA primase large subunit
LPPTLYDKIDEDIILDLSKLTDLVIIRYKILKDIENISQDKTKNIVEYIKHQLPEDIAWDKEDNNKTKNDIASHFLLALIMCKNESDMKWFIRQETRLYNARLDMQKRYNMYKILSILGIALSEFKKEDHTSVDINKIKFRLINNANPKNNEEEKIYFCKFEDALNLVPTHKYYLHKGNIYIPESDLPNLFKLVFEQKMEKIISRIRTKTESIKKDRRIREIFLLFSKEKESIMIEEAAKMAKDMPNDEKLRTMNDVDMLSERCFPLCMSLIERHINQYSHLTHFGRLQYTLFLKGAGLSVDESLKFFQKKYEKKTPLDKFEKEYAYNIKHSYGLEGKRVSYAPYNCEKIINMNGPMGRECHGCPFKTYSADNLRKILATCNLNPMDIEEIISKKKNNEYQLSCVKYFEGKFPKVIGDGVGIHPNRYFSSAMKALKNINDNAKKIEENNNMEIEENTN